MQCYYNIIKSSSQQFLVLSTNLSYLFYFFILKTTVLYAILIFNNYSARCIMKNLLKKLLPFILSISVVGSSCSSVPYIEPLDTTDTSVSTEEKQQTASISDKMPVLYIESASGSNDFVTKTVSKHVSEQIASWTPGYVIPPEPYYETCTVSMKDGSLASLAEFL